MDGLIICSFFSLFVLTSASRVTEMEIGKGFSWKNCDSAGALSFKKLQVSPDPVKYGQNMKISAEFDVKRNIGTTNTLKAETTAYLIYGEGQKADMCQYSPEACHIKDLCGQISDLKFQCPDIVKKEGNNCKCPLKKNNYMFKDVEINIPNSKVQVEGQYEVTVHITESDKPIGCLQVNFCLGECQPE